MAFLVISKLLLGLNSFWAFRTFCNQVKKGIKEDGKILRSLNRVEKRIYLEENEKNKIGKATIQEDLPTDNSVLNGVPEHIEGRMVRIYQPRKNPMQSGTGHIGHWEIEFNTRQRWENPNMGWCSSGDPLSNVGLRFSTREEAIEFCEKNGWKWCEYISSTQKSKLKRKKFRNLQ